MIRFRGEILVKLIPNFLIETVYSSQEKQHLSIKISDFLFKDFYFFLKGFYSIVDFLYFLSIEDFSSLRPLTFD